MQKDHQGQSSGPPYDPSGHYRGVHGPRTPQPSVGRRQEDHLLLKIPWGSAVKYVKDVDSSPHRVQLNQRYVWVKGPGLRPDGLSDIDLLFRHNVLCGHHWHRARGRH